MLNRFFILILSFLFTYISNAQICTTLVAYDYVEAYNWTGLWFGNTLSSGYYNNASVTPTLSAAVYGSGGGTSAIEQIGREYTQEEIQQHLQESGMDAMMDEARMKYISKLPKRTREPYPLPTLNINTEFWPYEGGECGVGPLDAVKVFESFKNDNFCRCLLEEDIQLSNYQSHPTIKAPLSN